VIQKLFKPIDNSVLIIFRIFFGIVFLFESIGALLTGWVTSNLVSPQLNFTFIGFEWLLPLMGNYMYVHFVLMAIAALGVTLGYKYRWSIVALTLIWGSVYFIQKTSYNNHYYLMWLICVIMCFLPANRYASLDVKKHPEIKAYAMPQWISWMFIFQISCVYIFATIAKFYPDWLNATVTENMFIAMKSPDFIKPLFHSQKFHYFIAYSGIAFDGLIIPALLWRRTRWFAIIASFCFHLFNSITLGIGVFPYFALCFSIFFFKPEDIKRYLLRKKPILTPELATVNYNEYRGIFFGFFVPYLALQTLLPFRHWLIKGDVLWTEEGHRLSWRMMLRSRTGVAHFRVFDKKTKERLAFDNMELLSEKQNMRLNTPDMIWQMAQFIQQHFAKEGRDVAVYVGSSNVSINNRTGKRLIDPEVDLTEVKWDHFKHHDWILDENDPKWNVPNKQISPILLLPIHQK